jgi:hypothetical protein
MTPPYVIATMASRLHVRHLRIVLGNIVHTSLDGLLLSVQGVLRICNGLVFLELKSKNKNKVSDVIKIGARFWGGSPSRCLP